MTTYISDTQANWNKMSDAGAMISYLESRQYVNDRKMRLITCALSRTGVIGRDQKHLNAINLAEQMADGKDIGNEIGEWIVHYTIPLAAVRMELEYLLMRRTYENNEAKRLFEMKCCNIIRHIVNPFFPSLDHHIGDRRLCEKCGRSHKWKPAICPCRNKDFFRKWKMGDELVITPAIQATAEAIYQERDWSSIPILIDQLKENGCDGAHGHNEFDEPNYQQIILLALSGYTHCYHCGGYGKVEIMDSVFPERATGVEICSNCLPTDEKPIGWVKSTIKPQLGFWALDLIRGMSISSQETHPPKQDEGTTGILNVTPPMMQHGVITEEELKQ